MLLKSVYDSQDLIPEWARTAGLFVQRTDGKWEIKHGEIEGIAALTNPGLAANRDALRAEKEAADTRASEAERRATAAEAQANAGRTPGSIVLSADDARAWQGFTQLGTFKEVKKIVEEYPTLKKKVELQGHETEWREAAKDAGVNFEVLRDTLSSQRGEGLAIKRKLVEELDGQNQKVKVMRAFLVQRTKEGEVTKETEHALMEFAAANWPAWLVSALQANPEGAQTADNAQPAVEYGDSAFGAAFGGTNLLTPTAGGTAPQQQPAPQPLGHSGVRLPYQSGGAGGGNRSGAVDAAALVKQMNEERDVRPNPLVPRPAASAPAAQK